MTYHVIRNLDPKQEKARYQTYLKQLKAYGFEGYRAQFAAIMAWINAYSIQYPPENLDQYKISVLPVHEEAHMRKASSFMLSILETKAKYLSMNDELQFVSSVIYGESIGLPIIKTLELGCSFKP